jgi:hypothetical protein
MSHFSSMALSPCRTAALLLSIVLVSMSRPSAARLLLSGRTGSCKNCMCTVTSIAECGGESVRDAARCGSTYMASAAECGSKVVTSIAECGESITKSCTVRRRRRVLPPLSCDFSSSAKSCTVPNKCNVPNTCTVGKSCDLSQAFGDCFQAVASSVSREGRDYMNLITNTGCKSLDSCKDKVMNGLQSVADTFDTALEDGLQPLFNGIVDKVTSGSVDIFNKAASEGGPFVNEVSGTVKSIASQIRAYTSSLPAFQKFNIGSVCFPQGSGFWYLMPTDCGAFNQLKQVLTEGPLRAQDNFNSAVSKFGQCTIKLGLLNFPTPFLDLKVEQLCLPDFIVTPMEYIVGAMVYTANIGQAIAQSIVTVGDKLKNFVQNKLNILQLATDFHRHSASLLAVNGTSSRTGGSSQVPPHGASGKCGPNPEWSIEVSASWGITFVNPATGEPTSWGFTLGLQTGCYLDNLYPPNLMLGLSMSKSPGKGTKPKPEDLTSTSFSVGLSFSTVFPQMVAGRVRLPSARLTITPKVKVVGVVGIGVPISLTVLPDPAVPSGFSMSFAPEAGSLVQTHLEHVDGLVQAASVEAGQRAHHSGQGEHAALHSMAAGVHVLAESAAFDSALEHLEPKHDELASNARHIGTHGREFAAFAQRAVASGHDTIRLPQSSALVQSLHKRARANQTEAEAAEFPPVELDISVSAGISFGFCLTPYTECFGQVAR